MQLTKGIVVESEGHPVEVPACVLNRSALRNLAEKLGELTKEAAERQAEIVHSGPDPKATMVLAGEIVTSSDRRIQGDAIEIFERLSSDEMIKRVSFNSKFWYEKLASPLVAENWFIIELDYSRTPFLDLSNISGVASNQSAALIEGERSTWVNGVAHTLSRVFRNNELSRTWLYHPHLYDYLAPTLGLLMAFLMVVGASPWIEEIPIAEPLRVAVYVWCPLLGLLLFRLGFSATRATWPMVAETKTPKWPGALVVGIVVGIVGSIIGSLVVSWLWM